MGGAWRGPRPQLTRCHYGAPRDGDHAHRMLVEAPAGNTPPNLFDIHPPFQFDGNSGATSGIAEVLLQGQDDRIQLSPAPPRAWPSGSAEGLRARGNFVVDLARRDGKLTLAVLPSELGNHCAVTLLDLVEEITIPAGQELVIGTDLIRFSWSGRYLLSYADCLSSRPRAAAWLESSTGGVARTARHIPASSPRRFAAVTPFSNPGARNGGVLARYLHHGYYGN